MNESNTQKKEKQKANSIHTESNYDKLIKSNKLISLTLKLLDTRKQKQAKISIQTVLNKKKQSVLSVKRI